MALLDAGEVARTNATTSSTQNERTRCWSRWTAFLQQIGLQTDPFLSSFDQPWSRNLILSAFAQAMRQASFSRGPKRTLVEGTVRTAIDYVAQTFRSYHKPDPRLDGGGKTAFIIQQQLRGYRNTDRNAKQQKALPACIIRHLIHRQTSTENIAVGQLVTGAFFFAMRSCEYLKTNLPEEKRRTKIIRLKDLRFCTKGRARTLTDKNIALSDTISITFEFQKSDERHDTVTMHRTGDPAL